jgi:hypothetical protein
MSTTSGDGSFSFPLRTVSLLCLLTALSAGVVRGQAPGLLWATNVGATVFAVDEQTNVYANAGGNIILLSSAGRPFQTNSVCPLPGLARRDIAGSYFFFGQFDGTQDFGGVILVGGWTNHLGGYAPGYPTCFLAKYGNDLALKWVTSFGGQAIPNVPSDITTDPSGRWYASYTDRTGAGRIALVSATGAVVWDRAVQPSPGLTYSVTVAGPSVSNCWSLVCTRDPLLRAGTIDQVGNYSNFSLLYSATFDITNSKPLIDDLGRVFEIGQKVAFQPGSQVLQKIGPGPTLVWSKTVPDDLIWLLARDTQSSVYLAGSDGVLAKYNTDGIFIWSNQFPQAIISMVVSPAGIRFLSLADGSIARLEDEPPPQKPVILSGPPSQTAFVGDSVSLSVTAGGTPPLQYLWYWYDTNLLSSSSAALDLGSVTPAQAGPYSVVVTNVAGAVTSAPALLRVKSVELFLGSQMLTNGTYVFPTNPTISVRSAFPNGSAFYTLDGSAPTFSSTFYSGPFSLTHSATVRAIGYSADFFQSEEADSINAIVLTRHSLASSASGGGSVSLNPPGGSYLATNVVTATATPAGGWSFLYWLGDAPGTNPVINISMEADKAVYAVFGTTLSTTVAGNGQILLDPPTGPYPYGSVVRLTAAPQPGNYFGAWGNAATGNSNPLYFTVSTAAATVSSIFGATPTGQAALTVSVSGQGRVGLNPQANVYPLNQMVTLTAAPDAGQTFLNWTGDASGAQNPLTITLDQSKAITANFTAKPSLSANRPGIEGLTPAGFRFTVFSEPQSVFQVMFSTNLTAWQGLGPVTNLLGEVQFTDPAALSSSMRVYKLTQ